MRETIAAIALVFGFLGLVGTPLAAAWFLIRDRTRLRPLWKLGAASLALLALGGALLPDSPSSRRLAGTSRPQPQQALSAKPVRLGDFIYYAPGVAILTKRLGNELFGTEADEGFSFALVDVVVKNVSQETASLPWLLTWRLHDGQGRSYRISTFNDIYLGDKRLRPGDIPPGAQRSGYLVFQVADDAKDLVLEVSSVDGSAKFPVRKIRRVR